MFGLLSSAATGSDTTTPSVTEGTTGDPTAPATSGIDWAHVWDTVWHWCVSEGIKLLIALIVLWLCFKIVNFIFRRVSKILEKRKADKTLSRALVSVSRKLLSFSYY